MDRSLASWRSSRVGKALMLGGGAALLNVLVTPNVPWAVLVLLVLGIGLILDLGDIREAEKEEQVRTRGRLRRRDGSAYLSELEHLTGAVDDLLGRLDPAQAELLGDVRRPVEVLEERIRGLVEQARCVDEELRHHDSGRLEQQLTEASARVDAADDEAARAEEQATLDVLIRQAETLDRVRQRRKRLEARLRTTVGMLSALHLDLVELLSTDLSAESLAVETFGEQLREVSRGVDALATALDDTMLQDRSERGGRDAFAARRARKRQRS